MVNEAPHDHALILIMISASLATFMSALDGTIVNIALPTIAQTFDLSTSSVSWVSTIYLLVMAGCLPIIGKIADLLGFKKIFLAGFAIFTLGSFTCGYLPELTGSFETLLASRVLQAIGGAVMTVIAPAMLSYYLPGERRAKGLSLVVLFSAVGMAIGPTLGGYLTEYFSWHWIFFINIPVGIIAIILGQIVIPNSQRVKGTIKGFDILGATLAFVGLAALLFAFSDGYTLGWTSIPIIVSFVLAVVCLSGFIIQELRHKDPLLDLRLFKSWPFLVINILLALLFFSFAGANYLLPFYLEHVHNYSSSFSGFIITALSAGMMIAGVVSGQVYGKLIGKLRFLIMGGVALVAIGFFMLTNLSPDTTIGVIVAALGIMGLGLGLTTTPLTTLIMGMVPQSQQGMVSSILGMERFAPMTIGVAVYNIIFISGIMRIAKKSGILESPPADVASDLLSAGFDQAFLLSGIFGVVLFILAIFIREEKTPKN